MPLAPLPSNDPQIAELKLPPHSVEAEQSVLGGMLLDADAWDKIADLINESDFYRAEHRLIWRHIERLNGQAKPVDVITVAESLQNNAELDKAGGLAYIGLLAETIPTAANIRRYAEIVRERSVLRKLAEVGGEIASRAYNPSGRDASQLLDEAESLVLGIAEAGERGKQGFTPIPDLLEQVLGRIETLYIREDHSDVTGVATGFADLDRMTSGLQPGDLIIVAGRPSMGKTAFSINIAEHVALEGNKPVAIFSMEMSGTQLAMRMIGSVGRVNQHTLRTGRLEDDDWPRLTHAMGRLNDASIFIDETAALSAMEIRARARRLHRQNDGLGLIVVDYLQLMSANSGKASENRATEISEISRSLKALAKELNVPVIALSQLNRSLEQRTGKMGKRPIMSDLRESGAIEQDADLILFIYRDEVYDPDSADKGKAEIIIGKQRNGPIGTVVLTFRGEYTRFENYAAVYYPLGGGCPALWVFSVGTAGGTPRPTPSAPAPSSSPN
ncbi:MAG: replicative DNA helicase [Gallionellaceae bacterium]|jgi:replicative DNA helicase|nr:replicative DNA helicase [Gallionellaceae bacterium]